MSKSLIHTVLRSLHVFQDFRKRKTFFLLLLLWPTYNSFAQLNMLFMSQSRTVLSDFLLHNKILFSSNKIHRLVSAIFLNVFSFIQFKDVLRCHSRAKLNVSLASPTTKIFISNLTLLAQAFIYSESSRLNGRTV